MAGLMIEGLPLWFTETNAWVVAPSGPGGECVLIDAPPDPQAILQRLAHHGLRLVALINTHGHVDHVGGVADVVRAQDHEVPVHIAPGSIAVEAVVDLNLVCTGFAVARHSELERAAISGGRIPLSSRTSGSTR